MFREIYGSGARLIEIYNDSQQEEIKGLLQNAEEVITENPELTYWFTGLRDRDDDGIWTWEQSKINLKLN